MMKIKRIAKCIVVMGVVSIVGLLILSTLTYLFKWQADKAMIGITCSYIMAGFLGGLYLMSSYRYAGKKEEIVHVQQIGIGMKMFEAIIASTIFMIILLLLSFFVLGKSFQISGRFFVIWMLLAGSCSLGRIALEVFKKA